MNGRNEAMKRLADAAARANTPLLRVFLGGVLVALAAFAVYANTLKNGFVWDDHVLIVNNPFVQDWANVRKLFSADYYAGVATSDVENAARPMWILSALVDVKLWGLFPAGHHLTSAVLHSLNSLLVFALGASLGGLAVALMAGLLFAVHPVHTEAVAAVGFRADLLAAFFALAAFLLYRARERWSGSGAAVAAARWGLLAASLLAYGAGLLSKEMAATLPLLLILHDRLLDPRTDAGLWRRAPLYLPYAALTGAYFMFHAHRSDFGFGG
jgi:protein O-mannosyl-transferase